MTDYKEIIKQLELNPHPEGEYYKEIYRSAEKISKEFFPSRYNGARSFSTSIYYMLAGEQISVFHKLESDEIWNFYSGSPLYIHLLDEKNGYKKVKLGNKFLNGELPQYIIPRGTFFAAEVEDKNSYSLIGCTVAPGFEFEDFEFGNANQLIKQFSEQKELILRLSKKDE